MFALRYKSVAVMLGAVLLGGIATPSSAAGGLFESLGQALFGRPAPQPDPAYVPNEPLSVTVRPRRRAYLRPNLRRQASANASSKPKPPAVQLDAATDPTWYLRDPTLRRGDIVVLKTGVVVFDGTRASEHAPVDFTPLGQTRLLSATRRQEIAEMAAGFKAPRIGQPSLSAAKAKRAELSASR